MTGVYIQQDGEYEGYDLLNNEKYISLKGHYRGKRHIKKVMASNISPIGFMSPLLRY